MITCNICIHKPVCKYEHEVMQSTMPSIGAIAPKRDAFELTRTEIRHILAENCQHYKSVMENK